MVTSIKPLGTENWNNSKSSNSAPAGKSLQARVAESNLQGTAASNEVDVDQKLNAEFYKRLVAHNPKNSSEVLKLLTSMLAAEEGKDHFTKMTQLTTALVYAQNQLKSESPELTEEASPELGQLLIESQVGLFGLNSYIDEFRKKIFFPSDDEKDKFSW